jgi:hypothetical protein
MFTRVLRNTGFSAVTLQIQREALLVGIQHGMVLGNIGGGSDLAISTARLSGASAPALTGDSDVLSQVAVGQEIQTSGGSNMSQVIYVPLNITLQEGQIVGLDLHQVEGSTSTSQSWIILYLESL